VYCLLIFVLSVLSAVLSKSGKSLIGTDWRFLSIFGQFFQKAQISCGFAGVQGWLNLTGETM
jgi:hypothetical protein